MTKKFTYDINHIIISDDMTANDLLKMLKEHDDDSFEYSYFTGSLNYAISKEYGVEDPDKLKLYFESGLFHDIGKLGMSSDFLNYPGAYTMEMYNEMKNHSSGGGLLLEQVGAPLEYIYTATYHHCNYDGSGYPVQLFQNEIPFVARLTRVSDSVDAYLSKRCYKEGGPANEALKDVEAYSGTSYDPEVIKAFAKVHKRVMEKCHKIGEDRPSKKLYMHFIKKIYLKNFIYQTMEDVFVK